METPQIITIGTILALVMALYKEWHKPVVLFIAAAGLLLITNVISTNDLLRGFANEQVAVIIFLLVLSSIIQKARLMEHWLHSFFSGASTYRRFTGRFIPFVAFISGFLNNTPIVAAFIPYVYAWGKDRGVSPSKLLIPLSYAAILGGTLTLIGTSTNLVVNGLAQEYGLEGFSLLDFTFVGLPLTIVGVLYIVFFGERLLPSRVDALDSVVKSPREYLVETVVGPGSKLIDKTVANADLRALKGLFLVEIVRGERIIGPVKPTQNIREGDHLIFAGDTACIPELINSNLGLKLPKLRDIPKQELIEMVEAVVAYNSDLSGRRVRDTNFRGAFDAAIVAIHRNGEKLAGRIGDIVLENGDLLVLMAGKDFRQRVNQKSFYLLSRVTQISNIDAKKGWVITLTALATILLSALGLISLFKGLLLFIGLSFAIKWTNARDLQKSVDLNLGLIAAMSLTIGFAMEKSGTAALIAEVINQQLSGFGPVVLLIGVYLLTNLLTEFVTNVAAATLVLPIAISLARLAGIGPEPYVLCVALAASFSFLSPIGYQTNLMVYGPGGYAFSDFTKFGFPLTILCFIITIVAIVLRYGLY
ncbi:MAG: SLC13 family permease [Bacteroidetes bacterium]|nr:SLC13 family permease [Bacteroidota bacterium]